MCDTILHYIRTGKLPEDLEKNQKDSLRRKSKNFLEKSGLLFLHDEKKRVDLQVRVCKLSRKGSKMEPNWHGPYRIHEVLGKGTFKLCNVDDSNKVLAQIYNMTRLKLYHQCDEDAPPADDEDSPHANPPMETFPQPTHP